MLAAVDPNRPDRLTQNLNSTRYFEGAYLATLIAVLPDRRRMALGYKQDARAFCSLLCRDGALAKYFFNIC
jgi:hypothetical protein